MTSKISESALPLYLFTTEEYHRMGEVGLFDGQQVELINGKIVDMSPTKSQHAGMVNKLTQLLSKILQEEYLLSVQNPLHISKYTEPEPDLMVLLNRADYYQASHPTPNDTLLVIEVSGTSLEKDQKVKLPLYASAGIPEVWIINLQDKQLEQYLEPSDKGYSAIHIFRGEDILTHDLAGNLELKKIFS